MLYELEAEAARLPASFLIREIRHIRGYVSSPQMCCGRRQRRDLCD
jgi:hypothetical protein